MESFESVLNSLRDEIANSQSTYKKMLEEKEKLINELKE